jgi:hypothetical protein
VIPGTRANGELGFRFGSPRDVDGDGIAEIAAGARFTDLDLTQMGTVAVWSSAGGVELAAWDGLAQDALFGHSVLIGSDIDRDGRPDIVASAPNGRYRGIHRGVVLARSVLSGTTLWSVAGEPDEALGWHLALAGDHDGDGIEDILAGAPGKGERGMVYLLDGRSGSTLASFASNERDDQFGWYVSAADLDGDGLEDVLVGAPSAGTPEAPRSGAAHAISSAGGRSLHVWRGREANGQLGEVVAALSDVDGDRVPDVGVSATFHPNLTGDERLVGEVAVFSGATGKEIFRFRGRQSSELYGRMLAPAGDVDGDGTGDITIGAPWWKSPDGGERTGRFEVRSGRSGEIILAEEGDRAGLWLGWHITAGENLGAARENGLVVSALRSEENGLPGAGSIRVYAVRR